MVAKTAGESFLGIRIFTESQSSSPRKENCPLRLEKPGKQGLKVRVTNDGTN